MNWISVRETVAWFIILGFFVLALLNQINQWRPGAEANAQRTNERLLRQNQRLSDQLDIMVTLQSRLVPMEERLAYFDMIREKAHGE